MKNPLGVFAANPGYTFAGQRDVFAGRVREFEELGGQLMDQNVLSRKDVLAFARKLAGKSAFDAAAGQEAEARLAEVIAARDAIAAGSLAQAVDQAVADLLLDGHPATWDTQECAAWVMMAGCNADRIQSLSRGDVAQKQMAKWVRSILRMLESHPEFISAHAGLQLLHSRAAALLGVRPNPRFAGRGEAWLNRKAAPAVEVVAPLPESAIDVRASLAAEGFKV